MPGLDGRRVRPLAGDGLVVRVPGLVAVIGPGPGDGPALVADACRLAATDGPTPAAAVAARLATLCAADVRPLPAVAALADGADGLEAVVHGSAAAIVADTAVTATEGTVVARPLPGATTVDLRLDAADRTSAPPRAELAAGTVTAGGATIDAEAPRLAVTTTRAPVAPPTPQTARVPAAAAPAADAARAPAATTSPSSHLVPTTPAFRSVLLLASREARPERRPPLPIAGTTTAGPGAPAAEVGVGTPPIVEGVLCDHGHLNDVAAARCRECGVALSLADGRRHTGPRPPLGLLVFDDGATYVLDTDYVIGRAPTEDPLAVAGRARPLVLDDVERTVSRVHAELRLEGWQVVLSDRGSTNGTFWWDGAAARWVRLVPSEARRLQPGDRAAIGRRVLTLETRTSDGG